MASSPIAIDPKHYSSEYKLSAIPWFCKLLGCKEISPKYVLRTYGQDPKKVDPRFNMSAATSILRPTARLVSVRVSIYLYIYIYDTLFFEHFAQIPVLPASDDHETHSHLLVCYLELSGQGHDRSAQVLTGSVMESVDSRDAVDLR